MGFQSFGTMHNPLEPLICSAVFALLSFPADAAISVSDTFIVETAIPDKIGIYGRHRSASAEGMGNEPDFADSNPFLVFFGPERRWNP